MTDNAPDAPAPLGTCPCGAAVYNDGFRDRESFLEFRVTGICQNCQDSMFLATCARDPTRRFPLRHGVVLALDPHGDEVATLPFLATAEPRLAWEARHILRVGARLQRLDPHQALAPMADALHDHAVRVHECPTAQDPTVSMRLADVDLLIVLDRTAARAAKHLPLPPRLQVVVLADEAYWYTHYATSLAELERAWAAEPEPHRSALRTCALLAWALTHRPDSAAAGNVCPIDTMIATTPPRIPHESS